MGLEVANVPISCGLGNLKIAVDFNDVCCLDKGGNQTVGGK